VVFTLEPSASRLKEPERSVRPSTRVCTSSLYLKGRGRRYKHGQGIMDDAATGLEMESSSPTDRSGSLAMGRAALGLSGLAPGLVCVLACA
jgi:hypothetical protein